MTDDAWDARGSRHVIKPAQLPMLAGPALRWRVYLAERCICHINSSMLLLPSLL